MAFKRRKLSGKANRKNFRRGAKVHGKNMRKSPMRGGIRL